MRGPLGAGEVRVVIVDNSCDEKELAILRSIAQAYAPFVHVLDSGSNLGYTGGFEVGVNFLRDHFADESHWVAISNVDLILDAGAFHESIELLQNPQSVGIIAPQVTSMRTGRAFNPYYRDRPNRRYFARLKRLCSWYPLYLMVLLLNALKSVFISPRKGEHAPAGSKDIYAGHGSFLLIRYPIALSWLRECPRLFLYGEEIQLAELCRSHQKRIVFCPQIEFAHDDHASTGWVKNRFHWRHVNIALDHQLELFSVPQSPGGFPVD